MKVVDFEPQIWFLLADKEEYFLDVNCSHSAFGFSRLIKLNDSEIIEFKNKGKAFIHQFANDIQYYALTKYTTRHISDETSQLVHEAIMQFNETK